MGLDPRKNVEKSGGLSTAMTVSAGQVIVYPQEAG
jgi:hypothetical protein